MNEKGFTLIELVVVIAIIGVLISITAPKVMTIYENANKKADIANREILKNAAEISILDNGVPKEDYTWDKNEYESKEKSNYSSNKYLSKWPNYPLNNEDNYSVTILKSGEIQIEPQLEKEDEE